MPVLLVDDDLSVVTGFRDLLSLENITSSIATDADAAEAMIAERFFPVVLADIRLRAHDDGLRLIEKIRRISPASRVAAMTGYATPLIEGRLSAIGAAALLHKPFDVDLFLATIRGLRLEADASLYESTAPRLRAMMKRRFHIAPGDCDDILQQAWCIALERRAGVRDMGAFLAGTVMNLSRQAMQRYVRERPLDALAAEDAAYLGGDGSAIALRSAMARLDERSRALCDLIGLEQLSYSEAAERLGLPIGSVGPLYMRAKERLRRELW